MAINEVRILPGLSGPEGLLVAIIARATMDLESSDPIVRESARRYFRSSLYQWDLSALDLEPGLIPESLKEG